MMIREVNLGDFDGQLELYTHLHEKTIPAKDEKLESLWTRMESAGTVLTDFLPIVPKGKGVVWNRPH